MTQELRPCRRQLLQAVPFLLAAGAVPARLLAATPGLPDQDNLTLLVGGPPDSLADKWAALLAPQLGRAFGSDTHLRRLRSGGLDGVTAANQLEWQTAPDGATVALLPAATGRAWLAGDPRVHFDAGKWVPLFAAQVPAILICTFRADLRAGAKLRVAADSPIGSALPGLLGLEQLGFNLVPRFGVDQAGAMQALLAGEADAAMLVGAHAPAQLAALPANLRPLFSLGTPNGQGGLDRDPSLPDVPHLPELLGNLGRGLSAAQRGAWRAAAAATRLEVSLVLPALTPASMVARWRQACTPLATSLDLREAAGIDTRLAGPPEAAAAFADLAADGASLLELRRFLGQRLGYTPI